jgi:predicted AlkP superfamily pyrophosphatase or phosphodiesterase
MRIWIQVFFACVFFFPLSAQKSDKPRLVIGIVVDQMRYDYLNSFQHLFGPDGFNRLLSKGQVFHEVHYDYIPTFTGPGHASVYTGTSPAIHGIAANDWYDRKRGAEVYCTDDDIHMSVGNATPGKSMSPNNLLVPTVTDMFKSQPGNGKVLALAIKDRGAILPGGKKADAAYWFDGKTGNWISSTYYMQQLPKWVSEFNSQKRWDAYLSNSWTLSLPEVTYRGVPDKTSFERPLKGMEKAVFPYDLSKIRTAYGPGLIATTPFGNSLTLDFAEEVIRNEQLGTDDISDFLCISFSSPDYIGHQFGPHSLELMDTYARLDRELATFFKEIDQSVGFNNVLVFLTSDHGAADIPGFSKAGGFYDMAAFTKRMGDSLLLKYGMNFIRYEANDQLYLDRPAMKEKHVSAQQLHTDILRWANEPWFLGAWLPDDNMACDMPAEICERIRLGFARGRSGDLWIIARPNWISNHYEGGGTTHGSPYVYDTHAPFILAGYGLNPASHRERLNITDIAPTVAALLGLPLPSGSIGKPAHVK